MAIADAQSEFKAIDLCSILVLVVVDSVALRVFDAKIVLLTVVPVPATVFRRIWLPIAL